MKRVEIFTDGACSGNPGMGGWGALLRYKGVEKKISGGDEDTTNNRMELTAVIEALNLLKEPCNISLYTDSKYVMNGITEWMQNWKKNNWKTSGKKADVKNVDLWVKLDEATQKHQIRWIWVKGHSGHPENELVDSLARDEIAKIREEKNNLV